MRTSFSKRSDVGGRRRVWLTGAALSLAGLLFAAAAVEVAVRVFAPVNLDFYKWQKFKRVSHRPGTAFEHIPGGRSDFYLGVPVQINALGLRDVEIENPKPPGTVRILGLGDSVTFGYGVRLEETYLKVLESELNAGAPSGARYQVVNAGIEGTALDFYYEVLRSLVPLLEPDLVIVGITLNDITDYRRRIQGTEGREFSNRSLVRRLNTFLLFHSQSYFAGYLNLKSTLYRFGVLDFNREHWYDVDILTGGFDRHQEAWSSSREALSNIIALARDRKAAVLFAVFPMEVQLDQSSLEWYRGELRMAVTAEALRGEPQHALVRFGESVGVPVLDLLPAFRAAGQTGLFLRGRTMSADPVHPSALGHRIAGHALFRLLREEPSLAWIWSPQATTGVGPFP